MRKPFTITMRHVPTALNVREPGDYTFITSAEGRCVYLCCPLCGHANRTDHDIVNDDPLTLSLSLVHECCDCHYFIRDGQVTV